MTWSRGSLRTPARVSVCLLLLAGPHAADGQASAFAASRPAPQARGSNAPSVRDSLDALNTLVARVPNAPAGVNIAASRLRRALDQLRRLAVNWPAESPADYRANLDRSVRLLDRALTASAPGPLAAILDAIADDLEVKLEHCTNSGGKLGGSVTVTVRTVRAGQEVRNWQVFYLPKVFDLVGGVAPDRFPRLSSPTLEQLVPGRYVMWARDPDGRTGEKTIVKVGEGRSDLQLDLLVPAGALR